MIDGRNFQETETNNLIIGLFTSNKISPFKLFEYFYGRIFSNNVLYKFIKRFVKAFQI